MSFQDARLRSNFEEDQEAARKLRLHRVQVNLEALEEVKLMMIGLKPDAAGWTELERRIAEKQSALRGLALAWRD